MRLRHLATRRLGALGAILSLGMVSHGTTSAQTPLAETRQRAEQGDATAQYHLSGFSYDYGLDVPEDDELALAWYRVAADRGHAAVQYHLGVMYSNGEGVQQDFDEAVTWYRRASYQGHTAARYHLGVMYTKGEGVPEDDTQAVAWFRQAADEGDLPAQYMLGVMYSRGLPAAELSSRRAGGSARGIPRHRRRSPDYVEAHKWFNLAASHVTVTSDEQRFYARMRDDTARQMTPAQLAEAQRLAGEWQEAFEQRQDEPLLGVASGG